MCSECCANITPLVSGRCNHPQKESLSIHSLCLCRLPSAPTNHKSVFCLSGFACSWPSVLMKLNNMWPFVFGFHHLTSCFSGSSMFVAWINTLFFLFFLEIRKAVGGAGGEWAVGLSLVLDVRLFILWAFQRRCQGVNWTYQLGVHDRGPDWRSELRHHWHIDDAWSHQVKWYLPWHVCRAEQGFRGVSPGVSKWYKVRKIRGSEPEQWRRTEQ